MQKILIVTNTSRPAEYTADLAPTLIDEIGVEAEIVNLDQCQFSVVEGKTRVTYGEHDIADFDVVYFKHWHEFSEEAIIAFEHLRSNNVTTIPSELSKYRSRTKSSETFAMALNNFSVPDSVYYVSAGSFLENEDYLVDVLGYPFILKATDGKKGADNYLVKSRDELEDIVSEAGDKRFIAQKFIPNNGDYRVITMGDKAAMTFFRTRSDESTHLTNTSQGGGAELVKEADLDQKMISESIRAAQLFGREIAGVDVMKHSETDQIYFLEINYSPQLTTGAFLDEKRAAYADYFRSLM